MGFGRAAAERQLALEARVFGQPSAERMDAYHQVLTAEPHHAGTPVNAEYAEYIAERLREFGFDEIIMNRYEVLLPRPTQRDVRLLAPERYRLMLEEPPLQPDPDTRKSGVLPPFNAYSADGDVTGEVIYVNYGLPEDYEVLESLGISVEGKIVIARYGRSWRGIKPKVAAEHGAVGCLIYSDPADDGFVRGDVMPNGKWRPVHSVQRGSVMDMPTYPGDPQTPGRPSKPGAERIPLEQVTTLQKIPVQPISYGDAEPILRNLGGPLAPEHWRGGLAIPYHVGPGPAQLRLRLEFDWSVRPIVNVIGILHGSDQPEKQVMAGGHRDAWTLGGRDPISGAVSLLETARVIGELAQQGHRPKRSIAIASWDAEEYGLIGSTEFGEEFAEELSGNLIVYLNRESYTAGGFGASGVHSLQPFVNEITHLVQMPGGERSVFESWAGSASEGRLMTTYIGDQVRLGALGSGSDYTVFLDHLGIPSVNMGFSSGNGIYHSRYDTRWYYKTYGDPGFEHGERLSELVALFLLRLANSDVLPFDYASTAETIETYLDQLDRELADSGLTDRVDLSGLRQANEWLHGAGITLSAEVERVLALDESSLSRSRESLKRLNDLLLEAERGFLSAEGLPGRPWFRHQIYAPGFYTGYGVKTLPGVREAIEKKDVDETLRMADMLEDALNRVRGVLVSAIVVAAEVR
jgi:N-acetylated-alpha-linked acidic dipeptidase